MTKNSQRKKNKPSKSNQIQMFYVWMLFENKIVSCCFVVLVFCFWEKLKWKLYFHHFRLNTKLKIKKSNTTTTWLFVVVRQRQQYNITIMVTWIEWKNIETFKQLTSDDDTKNWIHFYHLICLTFCCVIQSFNSWALSFFRVVYVRSQTTTNNYLWYDE